MQEKYIENIKVVWKCLKENEIFKRIPGLDLIKEAYVFSWLKTKDSFFVISWLIDNSRYLEIIVEKGCITMVNFCNLGKNNSNQKVDFLVTSEISLGGELENLPSIKEIFVNKSVLNEIF